MKILPRMFRYQYIPLICHGHMGIDLRDIDGTMSQHLLDIADIHVGFQEAGGKGVTEQIQTFGFPETFACHAFIQEWHAAPIGC